MLVLVDQADQVIGVEEKMKVHREGLLHRAFSIMIFNDQGQLLIQICIKQSITRFLCSSFPTRVKQTRIYYILIPSYILQAVMLTT
ncbi:MAG: hypothetical protein K2X94_02065 [Amoebophilaceae bacterium]|nr:hypothetical protein [Amoebophilaceae bacterium]